MGSIKAFWESLFFSSRFFIALGSGVAFLILAYLIPSLLPLAEVYVLLLSILLLLDLISLYRRREGIQARRLLPEKLSNGDQNTVRLQLVNHYAFPVRATVTDELPPQFQRRDHRIPQKLSPQSTRELSYQLRPVERGEYHFGNLLVFASSPLGLVRRRYRSGAPEMVPTYPAYLQLRRYQLLAISNRLTEVGVKRIRRLGHTTEFEQIKPYVRGDDYRTLNWKATARANRLMVNQYTDERSQNVYCLIDKSRNMRMPFEGMTLLDYAINASLVLSHVAISKHDKSGLITFSDRIDTSLPASGQAIQMSRIQEALYNQQTRFLESDYERLYAFIKRKITHRSLMVLFTNFESVAALNRYIPFLQQLSRHHLLLVIFFENTGLRDLLTSSAESLESIYIKAIAENFALEKKQIVRELQRHGIPVILTSPEQLTINAINKYLEMKARGMI